MDQVGNLYGTCSKGGAFNGGTVFKVGGIIHTILHNFGAPGDGQWPLGGLAIDANGNLYGTTSSGSVNAPLAGTVFKIHTLCKNFLLVDSCKGQSAVALSAA